MKFLETFFSPFKEGKDDDKTPDFEEQFEIFTSLGYYLNKNLKREDLDIWENGTIEYEQHPFELLYITLGQYADVKFERPFTNKCWDFDLEELRGIASHICILKCMGRISNNELNFSEISFKNQSEEAVLLCFKCNGDTYEWEMNNKTFLIDGLIFKNVKRLTEKYHTQGRYTMYTTGGHDFVLGYATEKEFHQFRKKTRLDIIWL